MPARRGNSRDARKAKEGHRGQGLGETPPSGFKFLSSPELTLVGWMMKLSFNKAYSF